MDGLYVVERKYYLNATSRFLLVEFNLELRYFNSLQYL